MAKSDAIVKIWCDGENCQEYLEASLTPTARNGWDERTVDKQIKNEGWLIVDDETHLCEWCQDEQDEDEDE